MFKRKITDEIYKWKNSSGKKKALVIKGMRQIGKTFIVKVFAEDNYESVVYINFKDNESIKRIFEGDFIVDRMTLDISASMPGIHFVPYKTVIIFDEVQECANARASIKAFMLDGRYDVICTGSLLGIKGYNLSNLSIPLEGNKIDNIFKIYMQDSGLFVAMLEEGSAGKILSGDMGMYKGAIYENIVADAF